MVPDHAEHGEPDVGHVLRGEPAVPDTQHVRHGLRFKTLRLSKQRCRSGPLVKPDSDVTLGETGKPNPYPTIEENRVHDKQY